MSEIDVLGKYVAFIAWVAGMIVIIGMTFPTVGGVPGWTGFMNTWSNPPQLVAPGGGASSSPAPDCGSFPGYAQLCQFAEWAWGGLTGWFANAGNILGYAGAMVWWFFSSVGLFLLMIALIATFTVPGMPFVVQVLLWVVVVPMWVSVAYIGIRAVRGGG